MHCSLVRECACCREWDKWCHCFLDEWMNETRIIDQVRLVVLAECLCNCCYFLIWWYAVFVPNWLTRWLEVCSCCLRLSCLSLWLVLQPAIQFLRISRVSCQLRLRRFVNMTSYIIKCRNFAGFDMQTSNVLLPAAVSRELFLLQMYVCASWILWSYFIPFHHADL